MLFYDFLYFYLGFFNIYFFPFYFCSWGVPGRLWPGFSPGKAPEQDSYHQEMTSRGSGQGSPQERLQNKIIITNKCLPGALVRGLPRKGCRTR